MDGSIKYKLQVFNSSLIYKILSVSLFYLINVYPQEGSYVDRISVTKGDSIRFYISSSDSLFNVNIYKWGLSKILVHTIHSIRGGVQAVPDSSYRYGCGWKESCVFEIPLSWNPGIYVAEFPTSLGIKGALFAVKGGTLGSYSDIVVSLSVNTWQAYNNFGGKSLYASNSTDSVPSYKVSFQRPFTDRYGSGQYFNWGYKLLRWLETQGIRYELTTSIDLYKNPNILQYYKILIIVGHDEYWSKEERSQIEQFVEKGGRIIILSGNTCYWQVRFEDEGKTMVCYRDASIDPLYRIADSVVTVEWSQHPVDYPENLITGVGFRNGGFVAYGLVLPKSLGYGDYAVYNSHHWIYNGTNLQDGDEFGWDNTIVGYEADGALFNWMNGFPVVTGNDRSPLNYKILGVSPAANLNGRLRGHATMGIYKYPKGGWVFNAATTDWVDGLAKDTIVQKITKNVINRFLLNKFPPDITSWGPFRVFSDSVNHELVDMNRRNMIVLPGASINMTVQASDPDGETPNFTWLENNSVVANSQVYVYKCPVSTSGNIKNILTAVVFNSHDTSSISWEMYSAPFKIVSLPRCYVLQSDVYSYKIDVLNYHKDSLFYSAIDVPPWLSIDQNGLITGKAPLESGFFSIFVRVSNKHGDVDSQSYVLRVIDTATFAGTDNRLTTFDLLPNFPNPFNSGTTIRYRIPKQAAVRLEIFNIAGQMVRKLKDEDIIFTPGEYSVTWIGDNEHGYLVSSGIYFCIITAYPSDSSVPFIRVKKMVLIR